MTSQESASMVHLGTRDGIRYSLAQTSQPWTLKIDAVVVSVGSALGRLGAALRGQFPGPVWDTVQYDIITPQRPQALTLPTADRADVVLAHAILVTPRENSNDDGDVTDLSLITSTRSAMDAAVATGARRIAIPLLGAGALFEPAGRVARFVVPTAVDTARKHSALLVNELVFLCQDERTAEAITTEFATAITSPSLDPELAGGISRDLVDANVGIPLTEDRLDIAPYVAMLATVIADRSTPLPLSVGLFGEWGSGKSYFMAMLRDQIRLLTESGDNRHCREVVHIGFNAWHYADSNLWASLGDEIFSQLAGTDAESRTRAEHIRAEHIRAELADRLDQRRELESATGHARTAAARLQEEVDRAVGRRKISALNLLAAVRNSPTMRETVADMWRGLGIDDEAEQAGLLAEQVRGTVSETALLARAATTRIGWISLAAAVTVLGLGILVPVLVAGVKDHSAWGIGLSATVTGLGGLTYLMSRVRTSLRRLRTVGQELRGEMTRAAEDSINRELADTVRSLRAAEADERVAQAQLDDVIARVGELGRELAELEPGRRLYSFLAARAQGDSYTGKLGLISTIRKDLQQLVQLMREWRENPDPDSPRRPIDRIVLYIDDLDRCSPDQIVDVLQAVHLLLAFDLFVVVVGVDPGWLLRSLRGRYADMLRDGDIDANGGRWRTPQDYIQKILNIPLVLPRMTTSGLTNLIQALAEPVDPFVESAEPHNVSPIDARPVLPVESIDREAGVILIEAGSQADDIARPAGPDAQQALSLTKPELALLGALDCFVDTPRDAKRLLNLYRMVRATRSLSPVSRFLGLDGKPGEFESVVVLLALSTTRSGLAEVILDAAPDPAASAGGGLAHRAPRTEWKLFVEDIEPLRSATGWVNRIVGPMPDSQVPQWSRLHAGLVKVSAVTTFPDLSDLLIWLPKLRRFSYTLNTH